MKYECKGCGFKDEIAWGVVGFVKTMTLTFDCQKCGMKMVAEMVFLKGKKKPKLKIEYQNEDYIC